MSLGIVLLLPWLPTSLSYIRRSGLEPGERFFVIYRNALGVFAQLIPRKPKGNHFYFVVLLPWQRSEKVFVQKRKTTNSILSLFETRKNIHFKDNIVYLIIYLQILRMEK